MEWVRAPGGRTDARRRQLRRAGERPVLRLRAHTFRRGCVEGPGSGRLRGGTGEDRAVWTLGRRRMTWDSMLDGNVLAGALREVFSFEATAAVALCSGC